MRAIDKKAPEPFDRPRDFTCPAKRNFRNASRIIRWLLIVMHNSTDIFLNRKTLFISCIDIPVALIKFSCCKIFFQHPQVNLFYIVTFCCCKEMAHKFCPNTFSLKERIYIQLFQFPYTVLQSSFIIPFTIPSSKHIYRPKLL